MTRTIHRRIGALALALATLGAGRARAQEKVAEFSDPQYGYSFHYPSGWALRSLPEGEANKDLRVILQGPNGNSFMVVVEEIGRKTSKEEFESRSKRKEDVEAMIEQTIEQTYKSISQNLKAKSLTIGERRDLSNETGVKFYVATLNRMPGGKPIIIAGIHAFPFAQDYSINFMMTAFWDAAATKEQEILTAVFNSFHLTGEKRNSASPVKPDSPAGKPELE